MKDYPATKSLKLRRGGLRSGGFSSQLYSHFLKNKKNFYSWLIFKKKLFSEILAFLKRMLYLVPLNNLK